MNRKFVLGLCALIVPMSLLANEPTDPPGNDPKETNPSNTTEVVAVQPQQGVRLSATDNAVTVRWQTASAAANNLYSVQRSSDGESWEPVFSLRCTNDQGREYAIYDRNLEAGTYQYRVRTISAEGDVDYSMPNSIAVGSPELSAPMSAGAPVPAETFGAVSGPDSGN